MESCHNVKAYGAKGDGRAMDTAAIQRTIDACSAAGGGRVLLPPGVYLSGTIHLASHIDLHLMAGAVLKGSTVRSDYNRDDIFPENQIFCDMAAIPEQVTGAHLALAYRCENVSISGQGTIDGHSDAFFDMPAFSSDNVYRRVEEGSYQIREWRPGQMICLVGCRNVTVTDVTLLNSPYWTLYLLDCERVRIRGLSISNPPRTRNGDGIDMDCCRGVTVSDCIIRGGDDCITLRANCALLGRRASCEDITVNNCVLSTPINAVRIGVGDGVVRNCLLNNLIVADARTAICANSRNSDLTPDGARIENVRVSNVLMDVGYPLKIWNSFTEKPPAPGHGISGLTLAGFRGRAVAASHICGAHEYPIEDIRLSDWDISMRSEAGLLDMMGDDIPYPGLGYWGRQGSPVLPCALFARHVRDMALTDFTVRWEDKNPPWRNVLVADRVRGLYIRGGVWRQPQADRGSAIRCRACEGVSVRGAVVAPETRAFLALENMPDAAATCVANDLG